MEDYKNALDKYQLYRTARGMFPEELKYYAFYEKLTFMMWVSDAGRYAERAWNTRHPAS